MKWPPGKIVNLLLFFACHTATGIELVEEEWPEMKPRAQTSDMIDVKTVFIDSLRMYFASLIGAFAAVKAEMERRELKRLSGG